MLLKKKRLGVNIDHIANIRESRKTSYPDLHTALSVLELTGVDIVTFHLREDRRHIQNHDVTMIKKNSPLFSNFESSIDEDIINFVLQTKPNRVTLVPEKRLELTTESGLNLKKITPSFLKALEKLKKAQIPICLFLDPDNTQIEKAHQLEIHQIELSTALYSECELRSKDQLKELNRLKQAAQYAKNLNMKIYAGHGLHIYNIEGIINIHEIEELNIGHGIIARAVFIGLEKAIQEIQNRL